MSLCSLHCVQVGARSQMQAPGSGPFWKTSSSCWFGAEATPDPLYYMWSSSRGLLCSGRTPVPATFLGCGSLMLGQGWEVQQNCKQDGNSTFLKGKIFLFCWGQVFFWQPSAEIHVPASTAFLAWINPGPDAVKWITSVILSGISYGNTEVQTYSTDISYPYPTDIWKFLIHVCHAQTNKKPSTSLSFLTIIILLIYFTRLQLKSFKYKFFFIQKV